MVRRFSSLFFRQSNQGNVAQAAADDVQARASHSAVPPNPIQRTDFPRKTIRHAKSSGALLGTLRSLQYTIQPQPRPPLPAQPTRGLGDLQESFWIEESLHRTTSQLDRCSNQLDEIHGSAAEVRRELEGLQVELELLQKKMQPGVEPAKREEQRIEQPKPINPKLVDPKLVEAKSVETRLVEPQLLGPKATEPEPVETKTIVMEAIEPKPVELKPADPVPKRPAIVKASSIQQRIQFFSKIGNN